MHATEPGRASAQRQAILAQLSTSLFVVVCVILSSHMLNLQATVRCIGKSLMQLARDRT